MNIYKCWESKTTEKLMSQPEVLNLIKNGDGNKPLIETIRRYKKGDSQYDNLKSMLPVVAWNVNFDNGKKKEDINSMSGYLFFDKDGLTEDQISDYKTLLMKNPYVVAVWRSVGGKGIGCLVKVNNVSVENYSQAWDQINAKIGIDFDKGAKKLTQVNIISFDPDIRINDKAEGYVFVDNKSSTATAKIAYTSNNTAVAKITNNATNTTGQVTYSVPMVQVTLNKRTQHIYDHTAPDKHPIIFKTKLDDTVFNERGYVVFPNGIDFLKLYSTYNKIPEGKRRKTLLSMCSVLLVLNPERDKEHLFNLLNFINKRKCSPPMGFSEVKRIFEYCYGLQQRGELIAKPTKRSIVFKDNTGISIKGKLSIVGTEMGKLRRDRTAKKLKDVILQLESQGTSATQTNVSNTAGVSIRTVKKYWKAIKDQLLYESWEPIPGFERLYEINKASVIRKLDADHTIKSQRGDRGGYKTVRLFKDGRSLTRSVHRLMALTYLPNSSHACCVNHINGIKTDNRISNLEWVTHSQNVQHAYSTGLVKPKGKAVYNRCLKKGYTSIKAAAADNNISYEVLKKHLRQGSANPTCFEYKN